MLNDVKLWLVLLWSTKAYSISSQQDELCQKFYHRESETLYAPSSVGNVVHEICNRTLPETCQRYGIVLTVVARSKRERKRYCCSNTELFASCLRVKRQLRGKPNKRKIDSRDESREKIPFPTLRPGNIPSSDMVTAVIESSGSSGNDDVDDEDDGNDQIESDGREATNSASVEDTEAVINSITAGVIVGIVLGALAFTAIVVVVVIMLVWRKILHGRKGENGATPTTFKEKAEIEESGAYRNHSYAFPDPVSTASYECLPDYANVPGNGAANKIYNTGDSNYDKLHIYGNGDHDYEHLKPIKNNESIEMHEYDQVPIKRQ